jgi:rubrerythrin
MHGEAFAYAKYMLFAEHARSHGQSKVADLFEQTAKIELLEHFAEEAELYGLLGDVEANVRDAIAGEAYEVETMYRLFSEQAAAAGDQAAADRFAEIRGDEADHRSEFEDALHNLGTTLVDPSETATTGSVKGSFVVESIQRFSDKDGRF